MRDRPGRHLATVLFIDIVDSTRIAAEVGDARWRDLLRTFRAIVRAELRRFGGREVDTAGDGFFATFARPNDAVRAAAAVVTRAQEVGLEIRCGLHAGELERIDGQLGGIAAHIGARVLAAAGPAEVLATSTVHDLVVGGTTAFDEPRETELKGVPGRWTLYRVSGVDGSMLPVTLEPDEAAERREHGVAAQRPRRGVIAALAAAAALAVLAAMYVFGRGGAAPAVPTSSPDGGNVPTLSAGPTGAASLAPTGPLPPIAMVRIDPDTLDTTAVHDFHVSSTGGTGLEIADGTLWAGDGVTTTRRDLATGEYLSSIELPPGSWKASPGFGSLWVGHGIPAGDIDRLDPISGDLQHSIEPREYLYDMAVGDTAVYLLTSGIDGRPSRILEIDPDSNEIVDDDALPEDTVPAYVGYQDGWLYLCVCGAGLTVIFDPEGDTIVREVPAAEVILGGLAVDPQTGAMWGHNRRSASVTPYDVGTSQPGQPIELLGRPRQVAFGFGSVWVAAEHYVYRIDSETHELNSVPMPGTAQAVGIAVDEPTNAIWVSLCYSDCGDYV